MARESESQQRVTRHAQADMAHMPTASHDPVEPEKQSTAPSTSSVLWAAWRQGLKDLQHAVLGNWAGTHEEPGSIANPTQLEVYQEKHNDTNAQDVFGKETGYRAMIDEARARGGEDRDRGMSR
jgi:hypothetical protein